MMLLASVLGLVPVISQAKSLNYSQTFVSKTGLVCSRQVMASSRGLDGKTVFASIPYEDKRFMISGSLTVSSGRTVGVPYVTSTALDRGTPGTAWKNCMLEHGAPVP
ncbi:MAG TPA: hypothetical protein VNC39_14075 [Acidocella sp.]|jgi:hypothetical protein|uniref:hypothetical protein n=1 Tax=Acidocella sp. TaxID=50710 RepID=UPI002BB80B04|nr:hypothetical protein [Acidocella sp.]HVE23094.1 hypothetical protein [Acidocella sp.]